jgi:hypothetical protein
MKAALIALLVITISGLTLFWGEVVASLATALGVFLAAWQLWEGRKIASASFEDSYDQQYRALAYQIPVDALIGKPLADEKRLVAREAVYNYLDLCNEQIYQRHKKRISIDRWQEWLAGIEQNLRRAFIAEVWSEVKADSVETFSFLERLEKDSFKSDPANWKKA